LFSSHFRLVSKNQKVTWAVLPSNPSVTLLILLDVDTFIRHRQHLMLLQNIGYEYLLKKTKTQLVRLTLKHFIFNYCRASAFVQVNTHIVYLTFLVCGCSHPIETSRLLDNVFEFYTYFPSNPIQTQPLTFPSSYTSCEYMLNAHGL
jgi:hypothetical protein